MKTAIKGKNRALWPGGLDMSIDSMRYKLATDPKWIVGWYLTNSTLCGLTLVALARLGYVPFDDITAFLLGFFVPIVTYGAKEKIGLFKYKHRLVIYQTTEVTLQRASGDFMYGNYEQALEKFESVLKYMPDHRRALYYAALSAEKLGMTELAAKHFTEYLKIVPDDSEAQSQMEQLVPKAA